MPWSELSVAEESALEMRHRAADRRAQPDRSHGPAFAAAGLSPAPNAAEGSGDAYDAAFYASRFKANLSQLNVPAEGRETSSPDPSAQAEESDQSLFNFFGNLSVLLVAVRAGDLTRARAAADVLEMEVLVERSAGRLLSAPGLDDLGHWLGAPQTGGESARAAENVAQSGAAASAPPDLRAISPDDKSAGSAYEMLAAFFDGEAQTK
jgi:hypothetical protein